MEKTSLSDVLNFASLSRCFFLCNIFVCQWYDLRMTPLIVATICKKQDMVLQILDYKPSPCFPWIKYDVNINQSLEGGLQGSAILLTAQDADTKVH